MIEKALERCQCITIISPVDPAEIQAQGAVADTHTHTNIAHTYSLGGVRICVCMCVYIQLTGGGFGPRTGGNVSKQTHTHLNGALLLPWGSAYQPQSLLRVCVLTLGLMLV